LRNAVSLLARPSFDGVVDGVDAYGGMVVPPYDNCKLG
jgi:hypothetical protein